MNLKNKTIVVTWASEWIGKEIALKLAQEKSKIALIARSSDKLDNAKNECIKLGASEVKIYSCDITNTWLLKDTCNKVIDDFWWIDILINNAGVRQKIWTTESIAEEDIDSIIATNLTALIHTTRFFLPSLKSRDEAYIMNIISKSWIQAWEWQSVYSASKFWVRWFTEVLKIDLKKTNVKVIWVYQSGTNTDFFKKVGEDLDTSNFTNPKDLAETIVHILSRPKKIHIHDIYIER
jgi:short-subunit dehydrogenase